MMDKLVFDKKTYITSKRAARISGYTKDYIGQLCRAGALPAKMVGRNWYIEEDALNEHRKTFQGESVIESSAWDIDQIEVDSRSLSEIAQQYVGDRENKRRDELIDELFDLKYEKEDGDLVPQPEKVVGSGFAYAESLKNVDEGLDRRAENKESPESVPVTAQNSISKPSSHVLTLRSSKREHLTPTPSTHRMRKSEDSSKSLEPIFHATTRHFQTQTRVRLPIWVVFAALIVILSVSVGSLLLERVSTYTFEGGNYVESSGSITFNIFTDLAQRARIGLGASLNEFGQTR